jgi:hypothetical protein
MAQTSLAHDSLQPVYEHDKYVDFPVLFATLVSCYQSGHSTDGPLTATKLNVVAGTTIAATYP